MNENLRKSIIKRDGINCYLCGKKTTTRDRQIDHVLARTKSGTDDESNLRVSCKVCNRKKSDKDVITYAMSELEKLKRNIFALEQVINKYGTKQ